MEESVFKPSTIALQALILIFSFCLIWFAFVTYPKIVKEKSFALSLNPFTPNVVANVDSFPIKTASYRVTHETGSGLYYVIVEGKAVDTYVENKNAAQLALKNALAVESLCKEKIIYASSAQLQLPGDYTTTSNCN